MNILYFLILYFIFSILFIIILCKTFFNKKNEIHSCKDCDFLKNNYCLYLNKKIKNINKLNCIKEE